jgi:flagellar biosynthesis protein FlhF
MRQAMRAIRERLGDDAVILSSRRVSDGVEVTAAIDFDAAALEQAKSLPLATEYVQPAAAVVSARTETASADYQGEVIRSDFAEALRATARGETPRLMAPTPAIEVASAITAIPPPSAPVAISAPVTIVVPAAVPPAPVAIAAPAVPTPAPAAVAMTAQPDDFSDIFGSAGESTPTAQQSIPEAVSAELKTLRRMLETQLAQLAWNDMTRRVPVHTEILRELTEIGINQELASYITGQLPEDVDLTYGRRFAIAALSQYLVVTGDRWLENGGRIAFIGATGVGKTTTLAKLAVRWVLRHGARDLALVAADGVRLGAQEQMRSLGQLLGAPVYMPETFEALPALLSRLQQRFILIDTPGSSLRDSQMSARLAVLANSASQLQTALVLAATTQAGALEEAVKRFAPANPCCCVLTKVDEATSLGGSLSALIRSRIPISYVSEGQRVPEDLRPARALELVSSAVRLAKASGAVADEDLLRRRFGKIAHAT